MMEQCVIRLLTGEDFAPAYTTEEFTEAGESSPQKLHKRTVRRLGRLVT